MQSFKITFNGQQAAISTAFFINGQWRKRTLLARTAKDLWSGLDALTRIAGLPSNELKAAVQEISKAAERSFIEDAIPFWLSAGNKIKIVKPSAGKLSLDESERAAILEALGDLDLLGQGAACHEALNSGEATLIDENLDNTFPPLGVKAKAEGKAEGESHEQA